MAHVPSAVDKPRSRASETTAFTGPDAPRVGLADDPFVTLYHELRSPLALIATTALGAASECSEGSTTRERLERITRVAERTLRVTETVLALARSDPDAPAGTVFQPADALTSLVRDFAADGERDVLLDVRPEARVARLFGQSGHFEGMVQALLTNARDHGAVDEPIRVTLEALGDTLRLTVDNRVAKQRSHHGLGIGTYLARRLAGELAGTLSAAQTGDEYRVRFTAVTAPRRPGAIDDCVSGHANGRLSGYLA